MTPTYGRITECNVTAPPRESGLTYTAALTVHIAAADLPRMGWPGTEKPAPALPDGWRLADHPRHGRVIVTTENPDSDGYVAFVHRDDDLHRQHSHDWCKPADLTYLDQEPTE